MPSIYDWDQTAGNNQLSDTDINWQEGQLPSTVNNSARAMMGRLAEFRDDLGGTVTSTNVADAYSVTANSSFTNLIDGLIVTWIASATNTTDSPTLSVNGTTAKSQRRLGPDGADDTPLYKNQIRINQKYTSRYSTAADSGAGAWMLLNPSPPGFTELDAIATPTPVGGAAVYADTSGELHHKDTSGNDVQLTNSGDINATNFASGTRMVFHQASAPTGWTQDASINDQMLRVVSSAGGGNGGSWTLSGVTVDSHALSVAELPASGVGVTVPQTAIYHANGNQAYGVYAGAPTASDQRSTSDTFYTDAGFGALHFPSTSVTSDNLGSGTAHTHGLTADGTWRPAYQDIIVCVKN